MFLRILLFLVTTLISSAGLSQAYPSKPVRMVVGFPPGGPADIFDRAFSQALGTSLGQPVIVENKSGVGVVLGTDVAAKAAPDHYTLACNYQCSFAIAPFAFASLP